MKYGIREICDVVLKAKSKQKIGNKIFYKDEPVCYFDSLKTSSLEGAATTVYAQGGRGNSRLVAWEGERTVTFTMEDALISTTGLQLLTGAGLVEPTKEHTIPVHVTEITDKIELSESIFDHDPNELYINTKYPISDNTNATIYINILQDGIIQGEPYIGTKVDKNRIQICEKQIQPPVIQQEQIEIIGQNDGRNGIFIPMDLTTYEILCEQNVEAKGYNEAHELVDSIPISEMSLTGYDYETPGGDHDTQGLLFNDGIYEWALEGFVEISYIGQVEKQPAKYYTPNLAAFCTSHYLDDLKPGLTVLLDYYTDKDSGVQQIEITPDKFGGNYYLEASTLFRDTNGVDMPAEFIIPNCKIQSNFTFSMASSGDPSTFTFTMDAFPDYTRFDKTKKVLSIIQVITDSDETGLKVRQSTDSSSTESK